MPGLYWRFDVPHARRTRSRSFNQRGASVAFLRQHMLNGNIHTQDDTGHSVRMMVTDFGIAFVPIGLADNHPRMPALLAVSLLAVLALKARSVFLFDKS